VFLTECAKVAEKLFCLIGRHTENKSGGIMKDFFCANCRKYKNIELKVMIKKSNGLMQAKCKTCVDKTKVKK